MKYVYCFTNIINGKKYIGSTINEPQIRFKQHMYHVKHNTLKSSYPLYQAIRKYGIENFTFEIIYKSNCSEQEIRQIEGKYMDEHNSLIPNGYNLTRNTEHPINDLNTYLKIRETKRNKAKQVAMLDKNSENILNIFRSIVDCAEVTKLNQRKIASCCRGERLSTEGYTFYWLDDNNDLIIPVYNRDIYKGEKGTTQIQSSSRKVAKRNLETGEIIQIYDTIALAARENNCDASGISKACRGKYNSCHGYKWEYIDE